MVVKLCERIELERPERGKGGPERASLYTFEVSGCAASLKSYAVATESHTFENNNYYASYR